MCRGYTPYTLKYHLDVVNHLKHPHCICVTGAERRTDNLALKATWWVMCVRETHSRGQRCYCLTHQHTVTTVPRLMTMYVSVCVHSVHWCSSDIWIIINHTHIHTPCLRGPLWPPLLFYGLTCHDRGMTATLSKREERKWEREGRRDAVSEWIEEGEEVSVSWKGEKRWKTNSETGPERRWSEREREGDSDRPDVLTLHSQSPVQWVQCEKLFMIIYVFSLSSVQSFVSIFSTLQNICAAFRTGCTILWFFVPKKNSSTDIKHFKMLFSVPWIENSSTATLSFLHRKSE